MKLIRPGVVNDATLTSSNVVEAAPAAYNGGTAYAEGDTVSVATGTALAVYTSLQDANTGHAPASSPAWWQLTGNTYAAYNSGTSYAENDIVIVAASHRQYQSLVGSNVGNPVTDSTKWLDMGVTNRWRMFDTSVSTQTSNPDTIEVGITATGRIDSVALLNLTAITARIVMTDQFEGVVYDETYPLVSNSGINNWYSYFFEPIERTTDLVVTDLPPYADALVEISISEPNSTARAGACIIGQSRTIGVTEMGARIGIQDYSLKQQDGFGDFTVVERPFSKVAEFNVLIDRSFVDELQRILSSYRATPIVWVGSESYASTLIFGFYRDFRIVIAYPEQSLCSLEIEGLT